MEKTEEKEGLPATEKSGVAQKSRYERFTAWVWSQPSADEGGFMNFSRPLCRVCMIVVQEFLNDKIPLRASALTFTVVLSMVPVLALGTAVLKGLGAGGQMRNSAHTFIEQLELSTLPVADIILSVPVTPDETANDEADHAESDGGAEETTKEISLSGHLHRVVDLIFDYVEKTDFAALGVIGVLVLFLAVFSVMSSIEQAMNDIWNTRRRRSTGRQLLDYIALMILLPITINLGVATMAALQSKVLRELFRQWIPWIGPQLLNFLPFLFVVATFTLLYSFLPNTRIRFGAAFTGGVFGGILWLFVQAAYFKLQIGVARYNAIYGSFASLPLFLLWIHVGWMVFLAGAELSFAVQVWRRYLWKGFRLTPINRLGLAYEIVSIAAADYQQKMITTRERLVELLKQPDASIREILDDLSGVGILRYVKDGQGYVPAGPVSELSALEIGEMVLGNQTFDFSERNPVPYLLKVIRKTLAAKKITAAKPEGSEDLQNEQPDR
ncbi:MAG: YihY/virulence factor BrkB family protein [Proteobacteria bacterium]|nr:YihY/virulence factor BrkB family protein [Pseudomonadota bacterium]MBU1737813.1 YihY/virulence factor BrkB family protein [Pseudomonadota bacterium]